MIEIQYNGNAPYNEDSNSPKYSVVTLEGDLLVDDILGVTLFLI